MAGFSLCTKQLIDESNHQCKSIYKELQKLKLSIHNQDKWEFEVIKLRENRFIKVKY